MYSKRSDLLLKYVLQVHTVLPEYPTESDVLFEISNFLANKNKSKFSSLNLSFNSDSIKLIYKDKLQNREFLEKLKLLLNSLVQKEYIIKTSDSYILQDSQFLQFFEKLN